MDILGKLFGSNTRIKLLRFFLFNPQSVYDVDALAKRSQAKSIDIKKECALLLKIGFIKEKIYTKEIEKKIKKGKKVHTEIVKKKVVGFTMNQGFEYADTLKNLLLDFQFLDRASVADRFKKAGRIKFLAISGVFLNNRDSRADILIVGDQLNKAIVDTELKRLEAEIGKDLAYALFETPDFEYRLKMYDKFIRDILDFEHHRLIEKMSVY